MFGRAREERSRSRKRPNMECVAMGYEPGLGELVEQIKQASENIADGDARVNQRIDGIETSITSFLGKAYRPAGMETQDDDVSERSVADNYTPCSRARTWPTIFRCVCRSDDSGGNGENGAGSAPSFLRSRAIRFSCGVCRLM